MNQLMPWDGEVVRMGWPWHGKIRQQNKDLAGYVTLPNGATRPAIAYYGNWPMNHTHLFDMGLPDQGDPQVEAGSGGGVRSSEAEAITTISCTTAARRPTTSAEGQS
ncbi:H+-ATPase subunit B [Pseudomonas phage vB_Pae_CF55b]|nr:H+-ATPase subunit B [Pseudomonas phage vB_Pae_CF55b]